LGLVQRLWGTGIGRRVRVGAALLVGVGVLLGTGIAIGGMLAKGEPVTREALAKTSNVRGAKDRTLGLSKVVIKPGAVLPLHHHSGTQVARIVKGTLTYTVVKGKAKVKKGDAETGGKLVRTIKAGETAKIKTGQWLVEQPSDHHMAANNGDSRLVIYLATLLRKGAPPSVPG
jgi:quercetin dioxygenase-like cupin family protein